MGTNQNFNVVKEQVKHQMKQQIKKLGKKLLIKIAPYIGGFILIAGLFFVIQGAIKDVTDKVVKAASNVTSVFDNSSDTPVVVISDDIIKDMKKQMEEDGMDIDETYLTDALLRVSLEAYYATQYPYIDGVDYGEDEEGKVSNVVKGAIYLKRENVDMQYINYNSFTSMMGEGKSSTDRDNVKTKFSVDNDGNIVVATWNMVNTVTKTKQSDDSYSEEGSETYTSYSISEYKIDQKTLTEQYAMSYKFPILLGNMYSSEGFGISVAKLGRNAKIELSIFDDTTETTTVSKEFLKENYKASGTYNWTNVENELLKTGNFYGLEWINDYTGENTAYKIITEKSEANNITVKPTVVDTWTVKGEVTDITSNTNTTTDSNITEMENDVDYKEDTTGISQNVIDKIKDYIIKNRTEGEEAPETVDSIKSVNAQVYKKITDHKMKTDTTTTTTTYTSSDMQLTDNTDKFLALIKADSDGNYSKDGELVSYIKKGIDLKKVDISNFNNVTNSGTTSNLNGVPGKIADFLLGKGMPIEGVAAVLGNIERESSFNSSEEYNGYYGLIQWGYERFDKLKELAKKNGKEWTDVDTQLEHMWNELCGDYSPVKDYLMSAKDVNSATDYFRLHFEKCGEQAAEERRNSANKWYKELKNKVTQTEQNGEESSSGDTYKYAGKTYHNYKQYTYTYTPPYYSATGTWGDLKNKGCMPSSLSIIVSGYGKKSKNGNVFNPRTFVEEVLPGIGGKRGNNNAYYSTYSNIVQSCQKLGLKAGSQKYTSSSNAKNDMLNHLKNGNPIIIHASAGYYTGGGHFMTLLGCDGNKVYLSNPGSSYKHGMIDINTLISRNVDWYCLIND